MDDVIALFSIAAGALLLMLGFASFGSSYAFLPLILGAIMLICGVVGLIQG